MPKNGSRLVFRLLYGPWTAEDQTFRPRVVEEVPEGESTEDLDVITVDDASPELVRLASHAHAGGALEVLEGLDEGAVQSQEEGEKALAEAQGTHHIVQNKDGTRTGFWDGAWGRGNVEDYLATRGALLAMHEDPDDPFEFDEENLARTQRGVEDAQKQLAAWKQHNGEDEEVEA